MRKLSWDDIDSISVELAKAIKADYKPDYIIGITTGGLIPLYFLVKELDIDNVLTVSATSYEAFKKKELKITYLPEIDLKDKKLLLVDEIAETGDSLKQVSVAIEKKYQPAELKTATLAVNTEKCEFYPDYYIEEEKGEWLVFPWEKEEFPEYPENNESKN